MTTMTVSQILEAAGQLSTADKLVLNRALVEMIRTSQRVHKVLAGSKFNIGQIVRFDAKRKGIKFIKIEKFNRAGTAVVGYECDRTGNKSALATRWTVSTTLCQLAQA